MKKNIVFSLLTLSIYCSVSAETVLITGANSGIGLALATEYADMGWDVIATHRRDSTPDTLAKLSASYDNVTIEKLDVTDGDNINALAAKLQDTPIDILLNNAGVINIGERSNQALGTLNHDQFDTFMRTNVQGPIRIAEAFYDSVKASRQKKIVMISSIVGSVEYVADRGRGGGYWYRTTKTALNMISTLLAIDSRNDGVAIGIYHPGGVDTRPGSPSAGTGTGGMQIITPKESAASLVARIDELSMESSGEFYSYTGEPLAW